MSDTRQLDVQEQIARLYCNQAESDKLRAVENKLRSEELKLRAEEIKLRFEGLRLNRDRNLAPWLAGASIGAGIVGLLVGVATLVGLLARVARRAG